tara:strand:+ start:81 stop:521 length:441 start_codon:yes stop_codon:yes gene_type:complete
MPTFNVETEQYSDRSAAEDMMSRKIVVLVGLNKQLTADLKMTKAMLDKYRGEYGRRQILTKQNADKIAEQDKRLDEQQDEIGEYEVTQSTLQELVDEMTEEIKAQKITIHNKNLGREDLLNQIAELGATIQKKDECLVKCLNYTGG